MGQSVRPPPLRAQRRVSFTRCARQHASKPFPFTARRCNDRVVRKPLVLVLAIVLSGCAGWTTYHHDVGRSGADTSAPSIVPAVRAWTSPVLDGLVYAEPLAYLGRVYVATENNSVYALDGRSGRVIWRTHLGTPVPRSALPCGNIDPLG